MIIQKYWFLGEITLFIITGEITLYCKGADSMIYERLKSDENDHESYVRNSTTQHLDVCFYILTNFLNDHGKHVRSRCMFYLKKVLKLLFEQLVIYGYLIINFIYYIN